MLLASSATRHRLNFLLLSTFTVSLATMFPIHILLYFRSVSRHKAMSSLQCLQDSQPSRTKLNYSDAGSTYSEEAPLLEDMSPPGTSSSFLRAHNPTSHWQYLPSGIPRVAAYRESSNSASSSRGSSRSGKSRRSRESKTEFAR